MNVSNDDISLALSAENVYVSFMRNCIILFTLGLTIINLTKKRKIEKYILSFIVILSGIIIGAISIIEYIQKINIIKSKQYKNYKLLSNTVYISIILLILFILIMIYKFVNINEQYKLTKIFQN